MNEFLNEAEAWREIASRIAEGEWSGSGICFDIDTLWWNGIISRETSNAMEQRINAAHNESGTRPAYDFIWPAGEQDERILYCLLMAEMWECGD